MDSCIKDVIIAKRGVIFSGKSKPPRLREEKRLNSKYGRERERGTLTAFYVLLTMELIRFEVLARLTDCCVPPVICVPNVFSLHLGKKKKKKKKLCLYNNTSATDSIRQDIIRQDIISYY